MRRVGFDHVLCLLLDVQRLGEHVENERKIDVSEVVEILPLRLVGVRNVVVVKEALVPRIVEASSCGYEEQIPQFRVRSSGGRGQIPLVEDVHEEGVVFETRVGVVVI